MKRLLLFSVLILLAFPAQARADIIDQGPAHGKIVKASIRIAHRYWGDANCLNGVPSYRFGDLSQTSGVAPGLDASFVLAGIDEGCTIWIDVADFGDLHQPENAYVLCVLIVHEYGHAMGYGHSSDLHSIMYPIPGLDPQGNLVRGIVPACDALAFHGWPGEAYASAWGLRAHLKGPDGPRV